jgi:BCD family chlorophyll transporter-like MFS transporter
MKFLKLAFKTLRLSLVRIGIGWMFALLVANFNRVSIADLGALAVIVTTLIGLHHVLSPFQMFWGRLADRYPLFGYRRTPAIILSALVGSLVFLALPALAVGLGERALWPTLLALLLFVIFGLAMTANGSAVFALIAEVTSEREKGLVVAMTQTFLILSAIITAGVAISVMPSYDPAQMQTLYGLTPLVVMSTTLLGVLGLERRIGPAEHAALLARSDAQHGTRNENPFRIGLRLLRSSAQVRAFFVFMLCAIMAIFLQDLILEPFGKEVFGMSVGETNRFTQIWGGGVLVGMLLMGAATLLCTISKKLIATLGRLGAALGLAQDDLSAALALDAVS